MQLTEEQQEVVDISEGRHLVLAPPGSGKTEMLTRRVVSALRRGLDPERMFCVTFTVRAGVEMRERVRDAVADEPALKNKRIPDIGNIHHFCNRLLTSNGLVPESRKVVDDIAQRELVRDVWHQLRKELTDRIHELQDDPDVQAEQMTFDPEEREVKDAVCVLDGFSAGPPEGMSDLDYYTGLLSLMDGCENEYAKRRRTIYPDLVAAAARDRRQDMGIPYSLLLPIPPGLDSLRDAGLLRAVAKAYRKLKDQYGALDFDDLITESYLALKGERVLKEEGRFTWIQVDEVQDLSSLQWEIVKMVSRGDATSVFFGDAEQTIFSFIGASAERLERVASTCDVHYFKKNFRATPYLLDILVRYSLKVLRSKWLFLPRPSGDAPEGGELYCGRGGMKKAVDIAVDWLGRGVANDVAVLVRTNREADDIERLVRDEHGGIRYVKVSGVEIFELAAMRDFIAFCSLLSGMDSLMGWGRMFRRFGGVRNDNVSRRLVKTLVDAGIAPGKFLESGGEDARCTSWMLQRLTGIRVDLARLWGQAQELLDTPATYRDIFGMFEGQCWTGRLFGINDYVTMDEEDEYKRTNHVREIPLPTARGMFLARSEKLLRYFDKKRAQAVQADPSYATRTLRDIMRKEWRDVLRLREADLIVGDEQIVISTIHKAKGRQFGGVVIPGCDYDKFPYTTATTPAQIDENARILYVGLSRAKRHLAVLYGNEPSRFLEWVEPCFRPGFENVFRRLSDGSEGTDWLVGYNGLLEAGLGGRCPSEPVSSILGSKASVDRDPILARIALGTVRYAEDDDWRRGRYADALARFAYTPEDGDLVREALKGIGTLRMTSFVDDNSIRKAFLMASCSPVRDELHFAMLECYGRFLERRVMTLDDVFSDEAVVDETPDGLRTAIRKGIEDGLLSGNGDVRLEAYRMLRENYDDVPVVGLDGSDHDWDEIMPFMSEGLYKVVRWLLDHQGARLPDCRWRERLETLARRWKERTEMSPVKDKPGPGGIRQGKSGRKRIERAMVVGSRRPVYYD